MVRVYAARSRAERGRGLAIDRAFFYAVVVGGTYALCLLLLLDNQPIALLCGVLAGTLALLRGMAVLR